MTQLSITSGVSLIGICGHAGAGKDTVAEFLISTYQDHYRYAFADPLKEAAAMAFGIPVDWFNSQRLKEIPHPNWDISPRKIAQFLGTEMFRSQIPKLLPDVGDDFWVKRLCLRINNQYLPEDEGPLTEGDMVVIPDVRFQNEYDWVIANNGIIFHLTRPGADGNIGIPGHASESKLNLWKKERTYEIVNNGTPMDLYQKVANVIASLAY
jgi:hypothetical protein